MKNIRTLNTWVFLRESSALTFQVFPLCAKSLKQFYSFRVSQNKNTGEEMFLHWRFTVFLNYFTIKQKTPISWMQRWKKRKHAAQKRISVSVCCFSLSECCVTAFRCKLRKVWTPAYILHRFSAQTIETLHKETHTEEEGNIRKSAASSDAQELQMFDADGTKSELC